MITLTHETLDKIGEAWSYQAATSCNWALSTLDKYSIIPLQGGDLEIETNYGKLKINNIIEFLFWKNKDNRVNELSTLNFKTTDAKIKILNSIFHNSDFKNIQIKKASNDGNYLDLTPINSQGKFRIALIKTDQLPNFNEETLEIKTFEINYESPDNIIVTIIKSNGQELRIKSKSIEIK